MNRINNKENKHRNIVDIDELLDHMPPDILSIASTSKQSLLPAKSRSVLMLGIIASIVLIWVFYQIWIYPYNYWKRKGFPYLEAKFPSASSAGLSFVSEFQGTASQVVYDRLAPNPYGGIIVLRRPHLFLRDLDIVKKIMVKDFDHFRDRINRDIIKEPYSENMFHLPGEKWRVKRVNFGPIFSASKMKAAFNLFNNIKKDMFKLFDSIIDNGGVFDGKETFARFSIDFIGSWTFGTRIDSLVNNDHVLKKTGLKMFPAILSNKNRVELCTFNLLPGIESILRFPFIPADLAEAVSFYTDHGLKEREKQVNYLGTNDLIDTLLKMKNKGTLTTDRTIIKDEKTEKVAENKIDLVFDDLSSEAIILFTAGFDTTSTTITNTFFELTKYPEIQDKLIEEIDEISSKYNGITYQALQEMKYLDQVVSETLRMYPPVPVLTRYCTKDYTISDHPEQIVERGTRVLIPVMAIQMDPRNFPEPHIFKPERFSDENKDNVLPYSYMPFGEGPRYCIGKRIGLIQSKMGVALTLSKYRVTKSHLTQDKIKWEPTMFVLSSKVPIWLRLEKRNSETSCA